MNLETLAGQLRASRGFAHKCDIAGAVRQLRPALPAHVPVGDDCAAIPDGDGHLLFAIEGLVEDFVERMPWFAGWSGVMVNLSDIAAMGGRAIAVVDAHWCAGADAGAKVLQGMADASRRYGVPIVGGHTNHRAERGQLAVAVLGRARKLLTSFDARPGDVLLAAIDLRGEWMDPFPFWNAATGAPGDRLRGDLELLPALAEDGLCAAAKDISMGGMLGTALMLLECSRVGAVIDPQAAPRPSGIEDPQALLRWLCAFPSFGFVLSVARRDFEAVRSRFAARHIACAAIGEVTEGSRVVLRHGDDAALLWDWADRPFITAGAPA